jgi:hypothetical protein
VVLRLASDGVGGWLTSKSLCRYLLRRANVDNVGTSAPRIIVRKEVSHIVLRCFDVSDVELYKAK